MILININTCVFHQPETSNVETVHTAGFQDISAKHYNMYNCGMPYNPARSLAPVDLPTRYVYKTQL